MSDRNITRQNNDAKTTGLARAIAPMALGFALVASGPALYAQEYPDKAVRIIVPTAPGGGMDRVARIVSEKLQEKWGKPFTVENRAGAGGNLGGEQVYRAAPDGYTLMISATGPLINNKNLYAKLSYDSDRFVPISLIAESPQALAVYSKVEAGSIQQLITLAKERPDKLNYGTPGNGTTPHLSSELFKSMAGVKIVHVPFKGSPPAFAALLGGQVDVLFDAIGTMLPHIKAGTIRPLAVSGESRIPGVNVPTLREQGINVVAANWRGVFGAPGIAPAQRAALEKLVAAMRDTAAWKEILVKRRWADAYQAGAPFEKYLAQDVADTASVMKDLGLV